MLVRTKGVVLYRTKYADSSLIVKVFTRQCGVVSFMVKNAFSKKAKVNYAYFSPLSLLDLTFFYKNNASLSFVKEVAFYRHFVSIPFDVAKNSLFVFYNELLYRLLYDYGTDEHLYDFIEGNLCELDDCESVRPDAHVLFMLALATELGFHPENNFSDECRYFSAEDSCFLKIPVPENLGLSEEASRCLSKMLDWEEQKGTSFAYPDENQLRIAPKMLRDSILDILIRYFECHNEHLKDIRSVDVFREVLGMGRP